MSRLGSRSMHIVGVAAALGVVLIGGVSAAAPAPSAVSGVSGQAVVEGTATNAAGMTIKVYTQFKNGDEWYSADVQEAVIGADGTYAFNVAYATNYYIDLEPNAQYQDPESSSTQWDTTYSPGWGGFAAIPGTPSTCAITAVPASTTKATYEHGTYWIGRSSTVSCDDESSWYESVDRFWSPKFNNAHFFTMDSEESYNIRENDTNWIYEGAAFSTLTADGDQCSAGVPVYRFYSQVFQSHFYTKDAAEKAHIIANDRNWTYEGVAYCAFPEAQPGTTALYRFWSPRFGKHFFTASEAEKNHIIANDRNWNYENIAYYVVAP